MMSVGNQRQIEPLTRFKSLVGATRPGRRVHRLRLTLLFFLALTSSASAAGWSAQQPVTEFYIQGSEVLVKQAVVANPDSCSSASYYRLLSTHPIYKDIYALILAARVSGSPVYLYLAGCDSNGRPTIQNVIM